jgi:hypothetical protein
MELGDKTSEKSIIQFSSIQFNSLFELNNNDNNNGPQGQGVPWLMNKYPVRKCDKNNDNRDTNLSVLPGSVYYIFEGKSVDINTHVWKLHTHERIRKRKRHGGRHRGMQKRI